jgi:DNA-binding LytR/AlgR family response regulator
MEQEIAVLIIEDEELWARSLAATLDEFGFAVAGTATNFADGIRALDKRDYDIVLLDIHLQGRESGIELGHLVWAHYKRPFIFITASYDAQTAQAAVAARPSAYLTKPVHPASLFVSIQTAIQNYTAQLDAVASPDMPVSDSFFVKQGDRYRKIFWKDVVALSSEKNYTGVLNIDNTTSFIRSTLPKTLRYLVPTSLQPGFVQVNRGEIVQVSFIRELTRDEARTAIRSFAVTDGFAKDLREKLRILS